MKRRMPALLVAPVILTLWLPLHVGAATSRALMQATPSECDAWGECLSRALEAEAGGDYERFHDLAWRAMQKHGRQDPEVMIVLARAQTLSGRPHDGLVMLRRITELGIAPREALTSEQFARTRALPDWPDLARRISELETAPGPPPPATTTPEKPPAGRKTTARSNTARMPATLPRDLQTTAPVGNRSVPLAPAATEPEEALRFASRNFVPAGLAHDVASGRVLVGNRLARSVITVSERLKTAVDLVRADSAGFLDVLAIAIDARRGDLWVASARSGAGESNPAPKAALHKLQLVSGRPLATLPVETGDQAALFTALSVTPGGSVFLLDRAGARIWKLAPGKGDLALVTILDLAQPAAMSVDGAEQYMYVSHQNGLARLSTAGANMSAVSAPEGVELTRIENLNWYKGSLVGIEKRSDAQRRLMRWHLNRRGTAVVRVEVIDPAIPTADRPGTATLTGNDVYYLAATPDSPPSDHLTVVVRRARLQ